MVGKSAALFLAAAVAEIGGAYLVWTAVKDGRGLLVGALGVLALGLYGVVAAFQPSSEFGRVLAAYGGVFIVGSLAWGVAFGSLEEIYEDPWTFPMFLHDHQVKVFAMTRDDKLESVMDVIDIDEGRVRTAVEHLQRVDVLGFADDVPAFLEEAERRFGLVARRSRGRWREATEDWPVPDALRRRIEADNQPDREFYERAREHAAERVG